MSLINRLYRGTRRDEVLKEWKTLKESSDGAIAGSCDFEAFKQSFVDRMFHRTSTAIRARAGSASGRRSTSGAAGLPRRRVTSIAAPCTGSSTERRSRTKMTGLQSSSDTRSRLTPPVLRRLMRQRSGLSCWNAGAMRSRQSC